MKNAVKTLDLETVALKNITLRNVKTMRHSTAFEAEVLVDGNAVAIVSDEGRGGQYRWEPTNGFAWVFVANAFREHVGKLFVEKTGVKNMPEAFDMLIALMTDLWSQGNRGVTGEEASVGFDPGAAGLSAGMLEGG